MFLYDNYSHARAFWAIFIYRYLRYVVNLVSFWTFRPIPPPAEPTLTSQDVTVILPSLEGRGEELYQTIQTILGNRPFEIILVTIDRNREHAEAMVKEMPAFKSSKIRCCSVLNPNKRRQMVRAIPEVKTKITVFADDDVTWPKTTLKWMLAPFEKEKYGGVVTCQRLRRAEIPTLSQRFWGFLGALYLERRNFDCAATTHIDGSMPCMSGRTVAYRTKILQDRAFTDGFASEKWWWGAYQLNADDDNFITRWMVSNGWETYMQYHPECEVQTTLEDNPKFLKQCTRWSRSNWRSNLTSLFVEFTIWRRHLWTTYAVMLTTLLPPAFVTEGALLWLCMRATAEWDAASHRLAIYSLLAWMFVSKFIKLLGHYVRHPVDILLLPVSVLFGYFHGFIKFYAMSTLNVTTWGSREGADANDSERMRLLTEQERRENMEARDREKEKMLPLPVLTKV